MIKRILKAVIVLGLAQSLLACNSDRYDGSVDANSSGPIVVNERGRTQYNQQCAGCHGTDGTGGADVPIINCANCTDTETLAAYIHSAMPSIDNAHLCADDCARDTAEYIMVAFHSRSSISVRSALNGVTALNPSTTLRKAALNLAGRMPTVTEQRFIDQNGEDGLLQALDSIMAEDTFYDRLEEIYNEFLLTDKYETRNGDNGGLQLLSQDDFPNRYWFQGDNTSVAENNQRCYRAVTNDAIAKEPLKLVTHLAKNNLPITGVVNADYIMVNWYSQKVYEAELVEGGNPDDVFTKATPAVQQSLKDQYGWYCTGGNDTDLPYDPNDFRPARITKSTEWSPSGTPHAGVLTSVMFLNRYPTTSTNRNRGRAKTVFDYFLDTDILAIDGERPDDSEGAEQFDNPTLENPGCYGCHYIMDPVASAFQHWTDSGRYIQSSKQTRDNSWDSNGILAPGLAGKVAPIAGAESEFKTLVNWVGNEIAQDARYRRSVVRILYRGLVGTDPIRLEKGASSADRQAYEAQRAILDAIAASMVNNQWNIKAAVKGIVMSPYYRAAAIDENVPAVKADTGAFRYLSPEQLQRKLKAVVGNTWSDLYDTRNSLLMGGMNSDDVTTRIDSPNGIMAAMQQRMAIEMACQSVAIDFKRVANSLVNERVLFPYVALDTAPKNEDGVDNAANISAIKQNIQFLHWRLLGEDLAVSDAEINHTYDVFYQVWQQGNALLNLPRAERDLLDPRPTTWLTWNCQARHDPATGAELPDEERINQDPNYVVRAWIAVMTYLLSDYRFIYE